MTTMYHTCFYSQVIIRIIRLFNSIENIQNKENFLSCRNLKEFELFKNNKSCISKVFDHNMKKTANICMKLHCKINILINIHLKSGK